MSETIHFIATLPPIMSAMKITGNGDGMRIQLDIPENEMGNAARLILMREHVLHVTIEAEPKGDVCRTISRRAAKKRDG